VASAPNRSEGGKAVIQHKNASGGIYTMMEIIRRALLWSSPASLTFLLILGFSRLDAAELPLVRIAHGAFSEKVEVMWLGAEQGLFRKHGVNVEVINIRSGPQTMAALVSGDIQVGTPFRVPSLAQWPVVWTSLFLQASSIKPTAILLPRRKSTAPMT
jgi:hypothetical protein